MNLPAEQHMHREPSTGGELTIRGMVSGASPAVVGAEAALPASSPDTWRAVRDWIEHHDHSWLFVAIYLGLAVGLSVFVSLFWLVFMAVAHLLLEGIRHWRAEWSTGRILAHAAWEVKLDFALVLLALGMTLYIDVMMGILGIQSAARAAAVSRAGARAVSRVAAWERNLRAFLLTFDELLRIGRAVVMLRRGRKQEGVAAHQGPRPSPWSGRWSLGDRIAIGIGVSCLVLIVAAPLLTHHSWDGVATLLLQELRPLPS